MIKVRKPFFITISIISILLVGMLCVNILLHSRVNDDTLTDGIDRWKLSDTVKNMPASAKPIYESLLERIQSVLPDSVQAFNGRVPVYTDSLLRTEPETLITREPITVLKKLLEGFTPEDTLGFYAVIMKIRVKEYGAHVKIGWVRAEDVIVSKSILNDNFDTAKGIIAWQYEYEPAPWHRPIQSVWIKAGDSVLSVTDVCDCWVSPGKRFFMTCGDGINIFDNNGILKYQSNILYTSPAWFGNTALVRGMYDDDAVYAINLKNKTFGLFFKVPMQYNDRDPDYGSGDGYSAYKTPVIDTNKQTVTIRFERHREDSATHRTDHDSYLLATTDLTGKLLTIEEKTDASQ